MHEWALAQSVIFTALKQRPKSRLKITIALGELQQVDEEIFRLGLKEFAKLEKLKATFSIKRVPAKLRCNNCNKEWLFSKGELSEREAESIHFVPELAHTYIGCPQCGSPDFTVVEGRGVWVEKIEVE